MHLERIRRYIAQHLTDPDLTPTRVAEANRISLRYLHWLFERVIAVQVVVVRAAIRSRHQHADVLPERLGGGESEQLFGGAIEGLDAAADVDHHHGIDGRVQQRSQFLRGARSLVKR